MWVRWCVLLIVGLFAVACASEEEAPADRTYTDLLALIPDTPDTRHSVRVANWNRFYTAIGITPAAKPVDPDRIAALEEEVFSDPDLEAPEWLESCACTPGGFAPPLYQGSAELYFETTLFPMIHEYLGFGALQTSHSVVSAFGNETFAGVFAVFDQKGAMSRLRECADCTVVPEEGRYRGETYFTAGEDFEVDGARRLQNPLLDDLGRFGRLWIDEGVVARTLSTAAIEGVIAGADGGPSLATNPDFRAVAAALDELEAFGVWISDLGAYRGYRVAGGGTAVHEGRLVGVLVLVHDTAKDAEATASRIEFARNARPDEELGFLDLESVDVEGVVVKAVFTGSEPLVPAFFTIYPESYGFSIFG